MGRLSSINMADMLAPETTPRTVKTKTVTTTDFKESVSVTSRTVNMLIQPADPKRLQELNGLDWAQEHITIHSLSPVELEEYVEYNGKDFWIVSRTPWEDNGFTRAIGESTGKPQLEVTDS